jgi:hypothetical protein
MVVGRLSLPPSLKFEWSMVSWTLQGCIGTSTALLCPFPVISAFYLCEFYSFVVSEIASDICYTDVSSHRLSISVAKAIDAFFTFFELRVTLLYVSFVPRQIRVDLGVVVNAFFRCMVSCDVYLGSSNLHAFPISGLYLCTISTYKASCIPLSLS